MENTQSATKVKIRPNIANMVKTPGGSFHKDDFIGNSLAGLSLAQVIHIAQECGINTGKYSHLNNGQIRMTLGGILRKLVKLPDVPEGIDYTEEQKEAANKANAVRDQITTLAGDFRDANKAAEAAGIAEKEAAIKAKADAKAATLADDFRNMNRTLDAARVAEKEAANKANAVRGQTATLADDFRNMNRTLEAARVAEKEAAIKAKADAKAVTKVEKVEKTPDIVEKVEKTPDIGETDSEGGTLD